MSLPKEFVLRSAYWHRSLNSDSQITNKRVLTCEPVTTKSQLGAETEDCANNVKPQMRGFLCKAKDPAKIREIGDRSLSPTCGATNPL